MVGHNKAISKNHFHKDWQRWLKINFCQVSEKVKRNQNRNKKARAAAPSPAEPLLPIVRCPTSRYNSKQRLGRGFSLAEIRSVGLNIKEARSIGIKVDHRRRNTSVEGLMRNKQRLQDYKNRLVLFPKGEKKMQKQDPLREYVTNINQKPKKAVKKLKAKVVTEEEKKFEAYTALRQAHGELKKMRNKRKKAAKQQVDGIK